MQRHDFPASPAPHSQKERTHKFGDIDDDHLFISFNLNALVCNRWFHFIQKEEKQKKGGGEGRDEKSEKSEDVGGKGGGGGEEENNDHHENLFIPISEETLQVLEVKGRIPMPMEPEVSGKGLVSPSFLFEFSY